MNIDDVAVKEVPKGPKLPLIFEHQRSLMEKYHAIETANGALNPDPPWNLDDKFVQWRLKDLFWRATEEVAEAFECIPSGVVHPRPPVVTSNPKQVDESINTRHFFEELIDSLHFLVEASIVANLQMHDDALWEKAVGEHQSRSLLFVAGGEVVKDITCIETISCSYLLAFEFIKELGLAANCLKNKQWKQTQMPTDVARFQFHLTEAWLKFFRMWYCFGRSLDDLWILYTKKAQVNEFRQRSNY